MSYEVQNIDYIVFIPDTDKLHSSPTELVRAKLESQAIHEIAKQIVTAGSADVHTEYSVERQGTLVHTRVRLLRG